MGSASTKSSKKPISPLFDEIEDTPKYGLPRVQPTPYLKENIENNNDFLTSILSENDWKFLMHEPKDRTFSNTSVVKAIFPISERVLTISPVFFIQSVKWVFHWDFTREVLGDPVSRDLAQFNSLNYTEDSRDFVLITLTKYHDMDRYSFELAARDSLPVHGIEQIYRLLKKRLFFVDKLAYRPLSKLHENIIQSSDELKFPIVRSDELFYGIKFQPLKIGITFGYLRLVRAENMERDIENARWDDILLCESVPNDIPVISGLITSELQTPLCHVALLCGNRGTPNVGIVDAIEHDQILSLVGSPVKFSVSMAEYKLELCSKEDVEIFQTNHFNSIRKGTQIVLKFDVGDNLIRSISEILKLPQQQAQIYNNSIGAKAFNAIEIAKLKAGSNILECAFIIPFYYYHTIMKQLFGSEATQECKNLFEELISSSNSNNSPDSKDYSARCQSIRQSISSHQWCPILSDNSVMTNEEDTLIQSIWDRIGSMKTSNVWERCDGIIFRSSTNAEDIEGFNAAGLYESIPISKEDLLDLKSGSLIIKDAIRKVWASVWNFRGFEERRLFGLDSSHVMMAILCQPYFSNSQHCNGVAVTAHPFRHDFPGHLLNVQIPMYRVTDSTPGVLPEQHIVWIYNVGVQIESVCKSSESTEFLLNESTINDLVPILNKLDKFIGHRTSSTASNIISGNIKTKFCVDVEFLIMRDTMEIVILQCRPYKMTYEYKPKPKPKS